MPSQKPDKKHLDKYVFAPHLIFQIQSYLAFAGMESMVFNHIIGKSLDVFSDHKNSNMRDWVLISPTEFGEERGYSRNSVTESLTKLVKIGILDFREIVTKTGSGTQKCREYKLVTNTKLNQLLEILQIRKEDRGVRPQLTPLRMIQGQGVRPQLTPELSVNVQGVRPQHTPCTATAYTLHGHSVHLARPQLTPVGVNLPESLGKNFSKDFLILINDFLKTLGDWDHSFVNFYGKNLKSSREFREMKLNFASLINRYGLYFTYTAMLACLFNEDAVNGDMNLIELFIKKNEKNLKNSEENLKSHSDNMYLALSKINNELDCTEDLGKIQQNFKASASALLLRMSLETSSSMIFIYSGFNEDVLRAFKSCGFNIDVFTNEILRMINLYYKSKILGIAGLSCAQE